MKASLHSVRIAPKKANIVAKMVRGMPVHAAIASLKRTNKKSARMIEELLKSAVANARHNDDQDPARLTVKTIIVNQGTALQRGVPMARGRIRPMRKFLSHISVTLGIAGEQPATVVRSKKVAPASSAAPAATTSANKPAKPSAQKRSAVQKKSADSSASTSS